MLRVGSQRGSLSNLRTDKRVVDENPEDVETNLGQQRSEYLLSERRY